MTLLTIVQSAMVESGLNSPTVVFGSTDLLTQQFLALARAEGAELYRSHDWTKLQTLFVVNVTATVNTTGNTTINSPIITNIPSTAAFTAQPTAWAISGPGIAQAARIYTRDSATQVTMDMFATAPGVGVALQFAQDAYSLPADFDHYIGETWWDRTNRWQLIGPDSPQIDEYLRSGIVPSGPRLRWRQVSGGNQWRIWPPPFAANDAPAALSFEYLSNNWNFSPGTGNTNRFITDTDQPILNDRALTLGIKWRYAAMKGFPMAAALQSEYVDFLNREKARDGGMPDLYMGRQMRPYLISLANVPDGSWNA